MARTALVPAVLACGLVVLTSFASSPPNLERTLAAQRQLVDQSPYDAEAHNDLGNLLILAGSDAEAEATYRRAVELDPRSTEGRFNLGLLLQQSGRSAEAEEVFEELLAIDPRHAWAHYELGALHDGRGDRSKALEHYARAFAYDPSLSFASTNPHVIDNKLSTEALLIADRYRTPTAARTPRHYSDPQRIAELMLDVEPGEDAGEDAAAEVGAEDEDGEPSPAAKRRRKRPAAGDPAAGDPAAGDPAAGDPEDQGRRPRGKVRQDRPADENAAAVRPRRRVGPQAAPGRQVGAPGGARSVTPAGQPAGQPGEATAAPPGSTADRQEAMEERFKALRERMRQGRGAAAEEPATDVDSATGGDGRDAATRTRVAPRRQRYRPGSASTGRLELRLLPEEPAERLAELAAPPA